MKAGRWPTSLVGEATICKPIKTTCRFSKEKLSIRNSKLPVELSNLNKYASLSDKEDQGQHAFGLESIRTSQNQLQWAKGLYIRRLLASQMVKMTLLDEQWNLLKAVIPMLNSTAVQCHDCLCCCIHCVLLLLDNLHSTAAASTSLLLLVTYHFIAVSDVVFIVIKIIPPFQ